MLAAGTVLRLPSGSASSIVASTSTTTTSQLCGTQLPVIGAWSLPTPSTVSDVRRAGAVQPDSREMKPIAVTPGEYLVSHVINGKPLLPLTSSTVDHLDLVGRPLAQVSSTVSIHTVNPLMGTSKPHSNGQQYGDWYTGHWWVGCYIWYSVCFEYQSRRTRFFLRRSGHLEPTIRNHVTWCLMSVATL